jgi:hypothetical protein
MKPQKDIFFMEKNYIANLVGIAAIIIALVIWGLDMAGYVEVCIYCRCERTMIGLLGFVTLLPTIPHVTRYAGLVFGFFGAHVASQQIFLNIKLGDLKLEFFFACIALFLIIAQVVFIHRLQPHPK